METRFTDDEKRLLEQAFQLRESQTEEQRAVMRAEFEKNWPALVAYVKQSEEHGEKMRGMCCSRQLTLLSHLHSAAVERESRKVTCIRSCH